MRLELGDGLFVSKGESDVVQTLEQTGAGDRVDGEGVAAVPAQNRLLREIDRHVAAIVGTASMWLGRVTPPAFSGYTPLEHMLRNGR